MGIAQMPLFAALKQKMMWHQDRQVVLAENVANAQTPGYHGKDLTPFSFEAQLGGSVRGGMATVTTNAGHIGAGSGRGLSSQAKETQEFSRSPAGTAVNLEDEMMKVAQNQMDYQAATTLYTRSVRIFRTALGRSA